jgi:hypothetical protein
MFFHDSLSKQIDVLEYIIDESSKSTMLMDGSLLSIGDRVFSRFVKKTNSCSRFMIKLNISRTTEYGRCESVKRIRYKTFPIRVFKKRNFEI